MRKRVPKTTRGSSRSGADSLAENADLLLACDTLSEVETVVEDRLVYYNEARGHSSLDYKRPMEVLLSTLTGGNIAEES